jgi:UDP-2-acetamido-3-amino-2,3-dideoxy-glucuronate N-acetyltransferase
MSKKIALIGCGGWGKNIARTLQSIGVLHTICELGSERVEAARKAHPQVNIVSSPKEVFSNSDVSGVIIATPPVTHVSLAQEAMRAGKDVLVEKPMSLSVTEGESLVAEAKKLNRILMVGHVLEYHPAILKLRDLITQGALGKIFTIQSNRLNLGRIRTEENSLWSFAPHDIALILRLLGESPDSIACHGGAFLSNTIADSTLTYLTFPSGAQAHIFVSWLHPFKEHKLIVVGSHQMAVFNDLLPWNEKLVLYPHKVDWVDGRTPVTSAANSVPVPLEPKEPLLAEIEHFIQAIETRENPLTDGVAGQRVVRVLDAAQTSLEKKGVPQPYDKVISSGFVHPSAYVDPKAVLGEGTKVWHFSHVMAGARIGKKCILGQNVHISRNAIIGNQVKVQNNVSVYEGVILEDKVFCGPSMVFTNVMNPRSHVERKNEFRNTVVGEGATLGANCTIVCGNSIGKYAFVGAGSVVTKNVPPYAVVVGSPARAIGWVCECGVKLQFNTESTSSCETCGKRYSLDKNGVTSLETTFAVPPPAERLSASLPIQ